MQYSITQTQLTCINIIIRTLQEAIDRKCFSSDEINNILKTIEKLTNNST